MPATTADQPASGVADLTLVPGLRAVAHGSGLLLVTDGEVRATVADVEATRQLLAGLAADRPAPCDLADAETHRALDLLVASGFVETRADVAARRRARSVARVLVDAPDRPATTAIELLLACGIAVTTRSDHASHVLALAPGEVDRDRVARWTRDDVAHLVVADHGRSVTVGPFVQPGRSTCLLCLDAHRARLDPSHPALVCDLPHARALTVVEDPALRTAAVAWAVRDLVTAIEGGRPASWSATTTLDVAAGGGVRMTRREWRRHPDCGCAWADALVTGS